MVNTGYVAETQILSGVEVFGADGEKVGNVAAVYPGYIVVEKGFFFPTDYYIPRSAINTVASDEVFLTISKDAALHSGWDAQPADLETATVIATAPEGYADTAILADRDRVAAARITETDEEIRIPVLEEELTATVRSQEAGAVRIAKDVVAEERTLEVPVTEERVRVERRVIDRPASPADIDAFEDQVIEVPLRTETVDIDKQARVKEEVVVGKEAVQRTERVSDTVRKERVFVEEEGAVDTTVIDESAGRSAPL